MNAIAMIDENKGLSFNHRPQSRDGAVAEDLARRLQGEPLYAPGRFESPFQGKGLNLAADPGQAAWTVLDQTPDWMPEQLIVYEWGRTYPQSTALRWDLDDPHWHLQETTTFSGTAHEEIVMKRYTYDQEEH